MMDGAMGMMGSERPMGMSSKDADAVAHASMQEMMANMKDFKLDTLLPGVAIDTSKTDYAPIEAVQLQRFNGKQWELFGEVMSSH